MNKLLENKLIELQTELRQERKELRKVLLLDRPKAEIMARKTDQIIKEYEDEKKMLKKYKFKDISEMVDYMVKLDFAIRDLFLILKK